MQIKKNLLQYKRDTYLNNTNEKFKYKKNLSIIKCDTNMKSLWNSINLNNIVTKQIFQYPVGLLGLSIYNISYRFFLNIIYNLLSLKSFSINGNEKY